MKAYIVTIGDEILIGQIIDTNSAWIANQMNLIGYEIAGILSLSDTEDSIQSGLDFCSSKADVILMTGGLGPTKDDITKKAIAHYLGDELVFHEGMWNDIQAFFEKLGRKTTALHKEQCYMPASALLLNNKMGTAPGMLFETKQADIISMPGVPYEMKSIMNDEVIPRLKSKSNITVMHQTLATVGYGETALSDKIDDIVQNFPDHLKLAFLPSLGKVRLRISGNATDQNELQNEIQYFANKIKERLSTTIFAEEDIALEKALGHLCKQKNVKIGFAESCTGGLISHKITSIPGSSAYFTGSFVVYSYEMKESLLGVKKETLDQYGAVSEETVIEMVDGGLRHSDADIIVAVSGIAGPGGGTPDKPVGTIWLAIGNKNKTETKKLQLLKDRTLNIEYTSNVALNLVRLFLLENY